MNEPVTNTEAPVDFRSDPSQYRHWKLGVDGMVATLTLDVDEGGGLRPGYRLKLNSYDLGVDIELHDALQRIRFEHPRVRVVVLTSAKNRVFSAGANIYMLAQSSHAWKVNFCKFTNETRLGMEDSSRYSGLRFLAACNGTTAGGGYELALACDEIILVDDRSSAVSLPEVALLGVLPGTGGLTRLLDKRRVRRDHADIFCTTPDGVRGQRAVAWRLVDTAVRTQDFAARVKERALALADTSDRPHDAIGVTLPAITRDLRDDRIQYTYVDVQLDRDRRPPTPGESSARHRDRAWCHGPGRPAPSRPRPACPGRDRDQWSFRSSRRHHSVCTSRRAEMTRAQIPEDIEEFRDERWRREASRPIETAFDAERFIERVGFAACLADSRRPGPSLYVAVCGRRDAVMPRNVQKDTEASLT